MIPVSSVVLAILPLVAGLGVGALTPFDTAWYATLQKPPWTPPAWVFGPVWSVLYLLMGIALVRVHPTRHVMVPFLAQLALNLAWTPVFFGAKRPRAALAILVVLCVAAGWTARAFGQVDRTAGLLLIPYLAWLALALSMNFSIVRNTEARPRCP